MIQLVKKASQQQLQTVREIAGQTFRNDELFHEFGSMPQRAALVDAYMSAYVDYSYSSKMLFANEDFSGFVALLQNGSEKYLPTKRLLRELKKAIPRDAYERFMAFSDEVAWHENPYARYDYLDVLMLCVDPQRQGSGLGRELIEFSMNRSRQMRAPLLIETDMPQNAQMYQHFGCKLMRAFTASNGVTRYNLIWRDW